MEIGLKVISEDIRRKSGRQTNSCFFTMVAAGVVIRDPCA